VVQSNSSIEANSGDALEQAFEAAISLHEQQNLVEAEKRYRVVLQADPTHFGSLHNLGMLCAQRRSFDEAIALLRHAIKQIPESAEAHDHLGSVLQALGRLEEAIICHDAALAIDADNPEAHYNRGVALQALDRHEAAIASYRRALAIEPSIAEIHYNAATAHTALKQHHAAVEHYKSALAIRPDYARADAGEFREHPGLVIGNLLALEPIACEQVLERSLVLANVPKCLAQTSASRKLDSIGLVPPGRKRCGARR
jgi:tetratricopeptide (TPR) repeat protein